MKAKSREVLASNVETAVYVAFVRALRPPICVDLDGTLVKSDTLLDGICQFVRSHPSEIWRIPAWLAHGRAHLKAEIARRMPLDPTRLPYNLALVQFLLEEKRAGRQILLATGADTSLAHRIAGHFGIFDGVLASDGETNLTRGNKLERLKRQCGEFDYIGNSGADLLPLQEARQAMVANPSIGLRLALRLRGIQVANTFEDREPFFRTAVRAIRVHQWSKNVLLFAPLVMSHRITGAGVLAALAAFFCFSFMASANYLVNDMLDMEHDRHHATKRQRPFAAGNLPVLAGMLMAVGLVAGSVSLLPLLPPAFDFWLAVYIAGTLAYSLYLKQVAIIDVLLLSSMYTLRLLAGGAATHTVISQWLAGFSTLLFLSLAMVKRFSELGNLREKGATRSWGRGYLVSDMDQIRSFGTATATASVVVFMLYIARPDVTELYQHPYRLWLVVPLLIYWLFRVWLLASRGELDEDPVVFALRDRLSQLLGVLVLMLAVLAT